MAVSTFAVVDIGAYDIELSIYEISEKNGIRRIEYVRHKATVGEDVYFDGVVSYELLDELCNIIKQFLGIIKTYGVKNYQVCASSAIRDAKNIIIVMDQIKVRTGADLNIYSNSEEKFLCYKAVAYKENEFNNLIQKNTAIVDVSSNSVQISLFDKDSLVTTQNMELGTIKMRELLDKMERDSDNYNRLLEELIDNDIQTFKKLYLKDREIKHVIAVGTSIHYFMRNIIKSEYKDKISREEFMTVYEIVRRKTVEQLTDEYNIPNERAPLILPAAMVYKQFLEMTETEIIWSPNVNLADGIVTQFAEQHRLIKLGHDFTEDILAAARNISKRYIGNRSHSQLMETNVCKIFDNMKKYHGMGKRERLMLQIAAILHDCGKYINMNDHADCSYNIIMSTEIIGLSHLEREIVANVVRYNTRDNIFFNEFIGKLSPEAFKIAMKLSAILKVCNALDRSHKQKFKDIQLSQKDRELIITTATVQDISLEQELFKRKADFFEEIYGIRPVLKRKKTI